jgi:hypothetical protein
MKPDSPAEFRYNLIHLSNGELNNKMNKKWKKKSRR